MKETKQIINGRYEVVALIGKGAQGSVYQVVDVLFPNRKTVIKLLEASSSTSSSMSLLQFEFAQLSKLDHPHLVKVFDFDVIENVSNENENFLLQTAFFSQEFIEGQSADNYFKINNDEFFNESVAKVCVAVSRALAMLHRRGLLHLDVKPSNILISKDAKTVKLIDLGLSTFANAAAGVKAGTIGYMSPEALEGFADERSDLYSLGATLGHLLSGTPPILGIPLTEKPPGNVSKELWSVAKRLTDKNVDKRFSSARETALSFAMAVSSKILGSNREEELLNDASEAEDSDTLVSKMRAPHLVGRTKEKKLLYNWLKKPILKNTKATHKQHFYGAILSGSVGVGKSRLVKSTIIQSQLNAIKEDRSLPVYISGNIKEVVKAALSFKSNIVDHSNLLHWLFQSEKENLPDKHLSEKCFKELSSLLHNHDKNIIIFLEESNAQTVSSLFYWVSEQRSNGFLSDNIIMIIAEIANAEAASKVAVGFDALFIELSSLELDDISLMVSHILGHNVSLLSAKASAKVLHEKTGGNPLLVEAILSSLASKQNILKIDSESLANLKTISEPEQIIADGVFANLSFAAQKIANVMAVCRHPLTTKEIAKISKIETLDIIDKKLVTLKRWGVLNVQNNKFCLSEFVSVGIEKNISKKELKNLHQLIFEMLYDSKDTNDFVRLSRHAIFAKNESGIKQFAPLAAKILEKRGDIKGAVSQIESLLEITIDDSKYEYSLLLIRFYRQIGNYNKSILLAAQLQNTKSKLYYYAALEKGMSLRLASKTKESINILLTLIDNDNIEISTSARAVLARIAFDKGNTVKALKTLDQIDGLKTDCLKTDRLKNTTKLSSLVLSTSGLIALAGDDYLLATKYFSAGADNAKKNDNLRDLAKFCSLKGMTFHRKSNWKDAKIEYECALKFADEIGDTHGAATYSVNLAAALCELDDYKDALCRYRDGIARLRIVGRQEELAQAGANYSQLLLKLGDLDSALKSSHIAVNDARQSGQNKVLGLSLCTLGDILVSQKKPVEAIVVLNESEKLLKNQSESANELAVCRHHLSVAHLAHKNTDQANKWKDKINLEMADTNYVSSTEHLSLLVLLAMEGKDDLKNKNALAVSFDNLLIKITQNQKEQKITDLFAISIIAKAAMVLKKYTLATNMAKNALILIETLWFQTPSLHRPTNNLLEKEMKTILKNSVDNASLDVNLEQQKLISKSLEWERLVKIIAKMNAGLKIDSLLDLIIDTALDVTGAQRGFLLLANDNGQLFVRSARNIDKQHLGTQDCSYSRTIAEQVYRSGESIVTTNAQQDDQFKNYGSIIDLNLRYINAVPLQVNGKTNGAVYVDSKMGGRFDNTKIELLKALADQAAIAFTNAKLLASNTKYQRKIEGLNKQLAKDLANNAKELFCTKRDLEIKNLTLATKYNYNKIIGASDIIKKVFYLVDRVTDTDVPVVIIGESGTGKELIAKAIHFNGVRKNKSFVAENCAAIPHSLLESILFGHKKGAFTGAISDKQGLFVEAHGGTLFLDEIGDMPYEMQKKLLRVLQEREVRQVGENKTVKVDVRIVVATNKDLSKLVKEKKFREDLFYRLNVIEVALPPLRDRLEDIVLLADHFIKKYRPQKQPTIAKEALETLMAYNWPGNIRQLENEIVRALLMCEDTLHPHHLSEKILHGSSFRIEDLSDMNMEHQVNKLKKQLITIALQKSSGNRSNAAKILGISRYGLQKMIARIEQ